MVFQIYALTTNHRWSKMFEFTLVKSTTTKEEEEKKGSENSETSNIEKKILQRKCYLKKTLQRRNCNS